MPKGVCRLFVSGSCNKAPHPSGRQYTIPPYPSVGSPRACRGVCTLARSRNPEPLRSKTSDSDNPIKGMEPSDVLPPASGGPAASADCGGICGSATGERHNTMIKSACCKGMPYRPEGNGHIRRRHSGAPGPTRSAAIRRTAIRSAPHDRRTLHVVPRPEPRTVPAKRRRYDVPGRRTDPTAVRREARSREHPRKQLRRSRNAAPCRRRIPASSPGSVPAPPALLPASCAPPCPKTAHRRRKCPAGNDVRPDAVQPHGPPCMLPKAHASVQINLAFPPACTIFEAQTTCS